MDKFPDKPLLDGPKRQHYLPRCYLEGFTRDGWVTVYDRVKDEIREQRSDQVCVVGHFYTFTDEEGRKRFELEHLLSVYEKKGIEALRKLAARNEINADERTYFAIFMAFAMVRTPDLVDSVKHLNSSMIKEITKRLYSDVEQVKESLRGKPDVPAAEEDLEGEARAMIEFAHGDGYEVKTNPQWAMSMAVQLAFDIAPILASKNWNIFHRAEKTKSFITADSPVLLTTTTPRPRGFHWQGVGFASPDALVIFPLDDSCALGMHGDSGNLTHTKVGGDYIRKINLNLANRCQRYIVGRDKALLLNLAKTVRLFETEWEPKFRML